MDVFNHFSCYTRLPVLLDDIVAHILDSGVVSSIEIYALDLDPAFLQGFCWVFVDKPHNSINHHRRAWIGYSKALPREMARMVICKELLHLLDEQAETAQQKAQVSELIDQLVLPHEAISAEIAQQDNRGILLALAVMLPRDAIEDFRPKLDAKDISFETVAKHARLPEYLVRFAFTPTWRAMLEVFDARFPAETIEPKLPFVNP